MVLTDPFLSVFWYSFLYFRSISSAPITLRAETKSHLLHDNEVKHAVMA